MKVLVIGGAKSGKSDFAQNLARQLAGTGVHYYLATLIPCDKEDEKRIENHLRSRCGMGFETLECGRDLKKALEKADFSGTFLLDSVTALLTNVLFPGPEGLYEPGAEKCLADTLELVENAQNVVFVSDDIFSDAERYDDWTECYRRWLGTFHRELAAACDTVVEVTAGALTVHKGVL